MTNKEKLFDSVANKKKNILVYDVETTGVMDGSDNRITQIALAYYKYNPGKGAYELQDHMFMLAKANEKSIKNILHRQTNSVEVAKELVNEQILYNYTNQPLKEIKNAEKRIETLRNNIEKTRNGGYKSIQNPEDIVIKVEELNSKIEQEYKTIEELKNIYETNKKRVEENPSSVIEEFSENYDELVNAQMEILKNQIKLKDVLDIQGIDLEKWRKDKVGLSFGEIQIGISNFVDKYYDDNTILVSNGTYFSRHYMEKEHLNIVKNADEIDISKCYGSQDWAFSMNELKLNYFGATGKEIKKFDALTKCLTFAEMMSKETNIPFKNTSKTFLEEQVKLETIKHNEGDNMDYVITMSELEKSHIVMDIPRYDINTSCFSTLEYIDFGSDRRYVDVDRMFEMNDNFEITLEGEKDPIKTWEELESKIKALNGEISPELLEKIHEKYDEIKEKASQIYDFSPKFNEDSNKQNDKMSIMTSLLAQIEQADKELDEQIELLTQKQNKDFELVYDKICKECEELFTPLAKKVKWNFHSLNPSSEKTKFAMVFNGCENPIRCVNKHQEPSATTSLTDKEKSDFIEEIANNFNKIVDYIFDRFKIDAEETLNCKRNVLKNKQEVSNLLSKAMEDFDLEDIDR